MNILLVGDAPFRAQVHSFLSHLHARVEGLEAEAAVEKRLKKSKPFLTIMDDDSFVSPDKKARLWNLLGRLGAAYVVVSSQKSAAHILETRRRGAADYIPKPFNQREFIMRLNALVQKKKRIACIGGGTGLFTLLMGLKTLPNTLLISIVNMSDDGGSSGKLSQSFGILPPGDIRRSLVALSNAPQLMNQIIQHRFEKKGELHGHSFGNIFLTALYEVKGSMAEAVRALSEILNIQGIVLPATRTLTTLMAKFDDGAVVKGENKIDQGLGHKRGAHIQKIWHEPKPECVAESFASIVFADAVVIGPGDLFTSVLTNLVVDEIRQAILATRARKIYVCNLMTKPGETDGFDAGRHVKEIVKCLGRDALDYALISDTPFSEESTEEYAKKNQEPVALNHRNTLRKITRAKIVVADLANETELVRHDSMKLKHEIQRIAGKL